MTQFHVIGLDPSMTGTGVAVIRPGSGEPASLRLITSDPVRVPETEDPFVPQLNRLRGIVSRSRRAASLGLGEEDIVVVVMEGPSLGGPSSSVQRHQDTRAMLRGLMAHTFETMGRPQPDGRAGAFIVVPPKSLKRYVTKNGNASKALMVEKARDIAFPNIDFRVSSKLASDDNLVDAYGLAAMACRMLGHPVEPSAQRVDPHALTGVKWPAWIEQNRTS